MGRLVGFSFHSSTIQSNQHYPPLSISALLASVGAIIEYSRIIPHSARPTATLLLLFNTPQFLT